MDSVQKHFYSGFELPLPRNPKNALKQKVKKKSGEVGGWVGLGFF
jgi:hypothetical protein